MTKEKQLRNKEALKRIAYLLLSASLIFPSVLVLSYFISVFMFIGVMIGELIGGIVLYYKALK